jgi:hypothetical protein
VSGLETLPPDQRAVLQLILAQGRGYDDLARTLKLDVAAVRERAHAGVEGLGLPSAAGLDGATRARIVDYLLGQQDDGERIVTFAELGDSAPACRWAQALREQLVGVAREQLPEVPAAAAAANGGGPAAQPREPRRRDVREPDRPRPSRLGGAILIAGVAALAIVLAIVLIGGGGDSSGSAASTGAARTQPSTASSSTSAGGSAARQPRTIGGAVLRPTAAGGSALAAALVQQAADGRRLLAVEAARLRPNGAQDIYAVWLQGTAGSRFLGFVPRPVGSDGQFTVSAQLPRNLDLSAYATVLVTREGMTATPTTPGPTILSGPLRLAG